MSAKEYGVELCDVCEAPPRQKLPPGWTREIYRPTKLSTKDYVKTHLPTCPMATEEER